MATYPNPLSRMWLDQALELRPTKAAVKQQYMGLKFFPMKTVYAYELTYDEIASGNRIAGIYGHNGVAIPGDDYDYRQMLVDIVNMMASRVLDNKEVMVLREPGEISVQSTMMRSLRQKYMSQYLEKLGNAEDELDAMIEYLCMHALQGTITWPPVNSAGAAIVAPPASWGDVSISLSMGFRATFIQNATTLVGYNSRAGTQIAWTDETNANPIKDLEVIAEYIQELTGLQAHGSTLLTSRTVLSRIAFNANILRWIRGDTGPAPAENLGFIDVATLKNALQTKLGYNIVLYDAQWTYPSAKGSSSGTTENRVKFLTEGKVIIIPPNALGDGYAYFATAPDQGPDNAYRPGKYTWFDQLKKPPWTAEFGVGLHGWPILRAAQEIFVLDVFN